MYWAKTSEAQGPRRREIRQSLNLFSWQWRPVNTLDGGTHSHFCMLKMWEELSIQTVDPPLFPDWNSGPCEPPERYPNEIGMPNDSIQWALQSWHVYSEGSCKVLTNITIAIAVVQPLRIVRTRLEMYNDTNNPRAAIALAQKWQIRHIWHVHRVVFDDLIWNKQSVAKVYPCRYTTSTAQQLALVKVWQSSSMDSLLLLFSTDQFYQISWGADQVVQP